MNCERKKPTAGFAISVIDDVEELEKSLCCKTALDCSIVAVLGDHGGLGNAARGGGDVSRRQGN